MSAILAQLTRSTQRLKDLLIEKKQAQTDKTMIVIQPSSGLNRHIHEKVISGPRVKHRWHQLEHLTDNELKSVIDGLRRTFGMNPTFIGRTQASFTGNML